MCIVGSWAMHKYASVYLLEAELFSTRQTNILAILASSETINIWGKRQLFWGKRQLASPCCNCINFFLPAYFEKQPSISLYRALSKCIAHATCVYYRWVIERVRRVSWEGQAQWQPNWEGTQNLQAISRQPILEGTLSFSADWGLSLTSRKTQHFRIHELNQPSNKESLGTTFLLGKSHFDISF